ncbi:hypothetical protein EW026_g2723 [Hermanssonia centrifuga]|uniref:F-box domain-containing protein n=1 Tax=Hermanssonia centrifuga TaxID=98765 RepID=A0A4S4KPB2_9APHY|nr:hypothetical protein EW026_g2723 [Hermanssonia centrifuga]
MNSARPPALAHFVEMKSVRSGSATSASSKDSESAMSVDDDRGTTPGATTVTTTASSDDKTTVYELPLEDILSFYRAQKDLQRREREMQEAHEAAIAELEVRPFVFLLPGTCHSPAIFISIFIFDGTKNKTHLVQGQLARQGRLLDAVNRLRRPHVHVHDIALRLIFEHIFPPPQLLDPLLGAGPDSPWSRAVRTKKALTLVCKTWRSVALPLLYEHVVLRRTGQIYALERTMRAAPAVFGPMVRSIQFDTYVYQNHGKISQESLVYILEQCENLRSLTISAAFLPMVDYIWSEYQEEEEREEEEEAERAYQRMISGSDNTTPSSSSLEAKEPQRNALKDAIHAKGPQLTELKYYRMFRLEDTYIYSPNSLIRASAHNLVSLTMFIPPSTDPTVTMDHLSLDALESLYLVPADDRDDCVSDLRTYCTWRLPRLQTVHFHPSIHPARIPHRLCDFLQIHQSGLKTVDLGNWSAGHRDDAAGIAGTAAHTTLSAAAVGDIRAVLSSLRDILQSCGKLTRMVTPVAIGPIHVLDSPLAEVEVESVDVWTSVSETRMPDMIKNREAAAAATTTTTTPGEGTTTATATATMGATPRWTNIRLFDQGLCHLMNVPYLSPPELSTLAAGETLFDAFGMRVVQKGRVVFRTDVPWDGLADQAAGANIYGIVGSRPRAVLPKELSADTAAWEEDSSDSSYVFQSDSEETRSSSSSSSPSSSENSAENSGSEEDGGSSDYDSQKSDGSVTLEEALAIFDLTKEQ